MEIKTIDVTAKEWFDKSAGNSYFSAIITLNFGMEDQKQIGIPFQYGYGDSYLYAALHQLRTSGLIPDKEHYALWRFCEENKIPLRTSKKENCLKREVKTYPEYI